MQKVGDESNQDTLIQSESGLFIPAGEQNNQSILANFASQEKKIELHNKERRKEIRAPKPKVRVPFSMVMLKAVRPKMINTLAHTKTLVNVDIEGDEKFKREAHTMVRVVSNEQEIVCVGPNVSSDNFKVGDLVKLDMRRFMALRDTNAVNPNGEYSKEIDLPIHMIDGHEYIMIDQRDIVWIYEENHQLKDLIGYEDEVLQE